MRWSLVIAALGLVAPAAAQIQEVTLDDAIRRALQVQPAMVQARGEARTAGAAVRASMGAFLPSLSTGGNASRAGGQQIDRETNVIVTAPAATRYSGSVSASLDLFDGFRRFADRSASAATQDAAEAGVVNQRFQVTLTTKQAFYDAL